MLSYQSCILLTGVNECQLVADCRGYQTGQRGTNRKIELDVVHVFHHAIPSRVMVNFECSTQKIVVSEVNNDDTLDTISIAEFEEHHILEIPNSFLTANSANVEFMIQEITDIVQYKHSFNNLNTNFIQEGEELDSTCSIVEYNDDKHNKLHNRADIDNQSLENIPFISCDEDARDDAKNEFATLLHFETIAPKSITKLNSESSHNGIELMEESIDSFRHIQNNIDTHSSCRMVVKRFKSLRIKRSISNSGRYISIKQVSRV